MLNHALALIHPDNHHIILLHHEEHLESSLNFVAADNFYYKALLKQPGKAKALSNHERLLPLVNQIDAEQLNRNHSKLKNL